MLTRRHIRIKVMQSLFAMKQKQTDQLDAELRFLNESMEQVKVLFLANLQLLVALRKHAIFICNANKNKFIAGDDQLQKSAMSFLSNRLLLLLEENKELKNAVENLDIDYWHLDDEYVKILFKEIIESDLMEEYISIEEASFKSDRNFILDCFKQIIAPNEKLFDYYEDKRISWVDDIPVVNTSIVNFLKKTKASNDETLVLPKLVKDHDDIIFAKELFTKTKLNENKFMEAIDAKTPNWDNDRIAIIDTLIIQLGICEFLKFPSIPVKVTINEYLEIAKEYSTTKSNTFINGVLDKLSKEYIIEGELNKIGRGLM